MLGILFLFIVCMIGILILLYWIPKKLGYPRLGKYLSLGLSLLLVLIITYGIFQDAFFTKNQARELLAEQDIVLKDDFKILNNKTSTSRGYYYHRFRLEISDKDKNRIIESIKKAQDFKGVDEDKLDLYSNSLEVKASKVVQQYESLETFVKELLRPNHEGEHSTYFKTEIEKNVNTLVFEEIRE